MIRFFFLFIYLFCQVWAKVKLIRNRTKLSKRSGKRLSACSLLRQMRWHSLSCECDIKAPSIHPAPPAPLLLNHLLTPRLTPRLTLRLAAADLDYSSETSAPKQAQMSARKFLRHPQMAVGGGLGPRGFDWSAPSNTEEKTKRGKRGRAGGREGGRGRSALLEEREASLGLSLWISQE